MKNIHVLPTLQASEYFINKEGILSESYSLKRGGAVHFYITSDEEIKEGDWFITDKNTICKCVRVDWKYAYSIEAGSRSKNNCKKIILTTDQDLIKDGVEVINDDFLEWFVKNPSCEEVVIDFDYNSYKLGKSKSKCYKIIIPKEEPKKEQDKDKYSEEEVIKLLHKRDEHMNTYDKLHGGFQTPKEWFEQFKNK